MAGRIRIDYEQLGTLAETSATVVDGLDDVGRPNQAEFAHSPCVQHGYHEFEQAWDKRRGELVEALRVVTDALAGIAEVFEEGDAQMAASLEGGD